MTANRKTRKAAQRMMARQAGVTIAQWKTIKRAKPAGMAALMAATLQALA